MPDWAPACEPEEPVVPGAVVPPDAAAPGCDCVSAGVPGCAPAAPELASVREPDGEVAWAPGCAAESAGAFSCASAEDDTRPRAIKRVVVVFIAVISRIKVAQINDNAPGKSRRAHDADARATRTQAHTLGAAAPPPLAAGPFHAMQFKQHSCREFDLAQPGRVRGQGAVHRKKSCKRRQVLQALPCLGGRFPPLPLPAWLALKMLLCVSHATRGQRPRQNATW